MDKVNVVINGKFSEVEIEELAQAYAKVQGDVIVAKSFLRESLELLKGGACSEIFYIEKKPACCKWHKAFIPLKEQARKFVADAL